MSELLGFYFIYKWVENSFTGKYRTISQNIKKNTTPKPTTSLILSFLSLSHSDKRNTYTSQLLLKNIPFTSPCIHCRNLKHDFDSISLIPKTIASLVSWAKCKMRQYALSVQNTQALRHSSGQIISVSE